jgi:hypothetical protein
MANKALSKRQKLMLRTEPGRAALKPRNPFAVAARERGAGTHRKDASAQRQVLQKMLKKVLNEPEDG